MDCVVTSPPYWGLRDYGNDGQLGLERTPEEYVANMVAVFAEVRRVLQAERDVLAESRGLVCGQAGGDRGVRHDYHRSFSGRRQQLPHAATADAASGTAEMPPGLKPKDLVGIPWRVAFALQADGWYLRSDIIWSKPNPMPESVTDRPTKAHEYLFLLTKSARYYFDADAVRERATASTRGWPRPRQSTSRRLDQDGTNGNRCTVPVAESAPAAATSAPSGPSPPAPIPAPTSPCSRPSCRSGASRRGARRMASSSTPSPAAARWAWSPTASRRRAILIDLNPEYLKQQMKRNAQTPLGLAQ